MNDRDIDALRRWDERIGDLVESYGLDCAPQEFEICDHAEMLGYMAYSGMPSHYPHWSYGKAYEKQKTLYDHGFTGLPYEMVINSDPSLAYLMTDNSLCLNVLTMAHVYGHNDFFRNNHTFSATRPEYTLSSFKSHADRIRSYIEDPSIGIKRVEQVVDAAHALSFQCRRNLSIRKQDEEELTRRTFESSIPRRDPHQSIHVRPEFVEPDLQKVPLEPEADILLFIQDYNPYLAQWQKDILTIVHEEAQYFIPQIETKIMNEGWASYWHYHIVASLELPEELRLEFLVHHNQVLRPHPGGLNPYHVGFKIWNAIYEAEEGDGPADHSRRGGGHTALFLARSSERDSSFLRRFLDQNTMRDLGLFTYGRKGTDTVVTEVADEAGWENIKETLIRNVGMNSIPVIRVIDGDYQGSRSLFLEHEYEDRELDLEQAKRTLAYTHDLWGRAVFLKTVIGGKPTLLSFDDEGFARKALD